MPAASDEQQERLRRRLAELSDPTLRAQRVAEMRSAMDSSVEEVLAITGLQQHEVELLFDFAAESMTADQLHNAECQLTPDCDQQALASARARAHAREMDRIIGPDAMQRFMARDARERVDSFARSLPEAHALSPATIDNLVEIIVASRRQWIDRDTPDFEVEQRLREHAASVLTTGQLALLNEQHSRIFKIN